LNSGFLLILNVTFKNSIVLILFFIVFLSLTGNSLSEKAGKVNQKHHFISFY